MNAFGMAYIRAHLARFAGIALYGTCIALTTWYSIWPKVTASGIDAPGTVHFVATRDLVKHHRVRADDLERPARLSGSSAWFLPNRKEIENRYVAQDLVRKGHPVKPDDVRLWPELDVKPGWVMLSVSLKDQPHLAEILNADSRALICPKTGKCEGMESRVSAVVCGRLDASACHALLEVPADAKTLHDFGSELRLVALTSAKKP